MKAVTAARLSAAFPYVTPAARARLESPKAGRRHIAAADKESDKEVDAGWSKAVIGPIEGLFNVRTSSQLARNDVELTLLEAMLEQPSESTPQDPSEARPKVRFEAIEFRPPHRKNRREAPLSWELSEDD